jgi:transposase
VLLFFQRDHFGTDVRYLLTRCAIRGTCELLGDLCDCQLSEGTLTAWTQQAAQTLEPTVKRIADRISASRLQHGDETGIRVGGKLHWMHVNSTRWRYKLRKA